MFDFQECFRNLTGTDGPFPWQERLFLRFIEGRIPYACDIPTGLGKTSVIAIWLLALAQSFINKDSPRRIPIRLVYVVDRRVIVDQSTDEAKRVIWALEQAESQSENPLYPVAKALREAAFVTDGPLIALSALRGQMAESRDWCLDPSRPAIIIGTVDMVGSRLLFSGYGGVGRSHRSLQAGLIGQDTLVLIDEAHLSPTFVGTVEDIRRAVHQFKVIRPFEVMSLSATIPIRGLGANNDLKEEPPLFDPEQELKNEEARNRLNADKHIEWVYFDQPTKDKKKPAYKAIEEQLATTIVERAVQYEGRPLSIVIFVSTVGLVNQVAQKLIEKLGERSVERILKMTGEMRGFERDQLTENDKFKVFLPHRDRNTTRLTHYLIATSCVEVGVNLDADHGVCDLTSLDRMIQRIGRINRFGKTSSIVTVVVERNAIDATASDIDREKSFDEHLKDADKHIANVEKQGEELKEETRGLKAKDKNVAIMEKIKAAEAELKAAKETRKKIEKDGIKYDKQFENVERVDRTVYHTWLALKRRQTGNGKVDASPLALRDLTRDPKTWPPPPVRPPLDSSRLDDWSMTSLRQAEFRRPLVAYWLRGVTADETAQTTFCWRADLNYSASLDQAEAMVRAIPFTPCERAVLATFRAMDAIVELAKHWPDKMIVIIDASGEYEAIVLRGLIEDKNALFGRLAYATVVIPNKLGGLSGDGNVLDKPLKTSAAVPDVVDEDEWTRYAVRELGDGGYECGRLLSDGDMGAWMNYADWKAVIRRCTEESGGICTNSKELQKAFADSASESEESEVREESQAKSAILIAYFLSRQSSQHYLREGDDLASVGMQRGRSVDEHDMDVEQYVMRVAKKIGLDDELITSFGLAGRMHDRGKKRDWWQAAIGNPKTDNKDWQPLAKSTHKSFDSNLNRNYRHEFGSLVETEVDVELKEHPHRDLILHLIAAHHGYARPHFPSETFDGNQPTAVNRKIAEEAMQRFTRLQRKYGWWQLAYLEAVLKAADALASRDFNRGRL